MKQKSKECGERHWRRKAEEKSVGKIVLMRKAKVEEWSGGKWWRGV